MPTVLPFQVPAVKVPTPVIPVYDPDIRAEASVPDEMLEALIAVIAAPLPEKLFAPTTLASKDPLTSRSTIVEAPLAEEAVVRAFDIVPVEMLDALMAVMATPLPTNDEAFTVLASKFPDVSLNTIVLAPLA